MNESIILDLKLNSNDVINAFKRIENTVQAIGQALDKAFGNKNFANAVNNLNKNLEQTKGQVRGVAREMDVLARKQSQAYKSLNFGRALTQFGNLLTSFTNGPLARFTNVVTGTLVSQMTGLFTSALTGGIERYDIFKKFPQIMSAFGISSEDATASINKMDLALRGLPTGLDEAVNSAQRFASVLYGQGKYLNNLGDRSSDIALAVNSAFLASGSGEEQIYQGTQQLIDLMAKGQLTSREWLSLQRSMPLAMGKISKELGYKDFISLSQAVNDGTVSVDQFYDALIRLGTGSGELKRLADISKTTMSALGRNIQNASNRLVAGFLQTLDSITQSKFGKSLAPWLSEQLISRIDGLNQAFSNWAQANPDKIINFFNKIAEVPWEKIISNLAKMTALKWKAFLFFLKTVPAPILAFTSALAGPVGRAVQSIGFMWQGISRWKLYNLEKQRAKLDDNVIGRRGIFTSLKNFFRANKNLDKEAKSAQKAMGKGGSSIQRITKTMVTNSQRELEISNNQLGMAVNSFKRFGLGLLKIAGAMGIVVAGVLAFRVVASQLAKIGEIDINISKVTTNLLTVVTTMSMLTAYFAGLGALLSKWKSMSLTLYTLAGIGLTSGMAVAFRGIAQLLSEIASVDLPFENLQKKILTIATAVAELNVLFIALGGLHILSGGVLAIAGAIGALFSTGIVYDTLKLVRWLSEIAEVDIDRGTIQRQLDSLSGILEDVTAFFGTEAILKVNMMSQGSASNLKKLMRNLRDTFDDLGAINNTLATIKPIPGDVTYKLEKVIEVMREVYAKIDEFATLSKWDSSGTVTKRSTKTASQISANLSSMLSPINAMLGSLIAIPKMLKELTDADLTLNFEDIQDKLDKTLGAVLKLYESIDEKFILTFAERINGLSTTTSQQGARATEKASTITQNLSTMLNSIQSMLYGITNIVSNMYTKFPNASRIEEIFGGTTADGERRKGKLSSVLDDINEFVNELYSAMEQFVNIGEQNATVEGRSGSKQVSWAKKLRQADLIAKVEEYTTNISNIITALTNIADSVKTLATSVPKVGEVGVLSTQIQTLFEQLDTMFIDLYKLDMWDDVGEFETDFTSLSTTFESLKTAVGYIAEIVPQLSSLGPNKETGKLAFIQKIKDIISQLTDVLSADATDSLKESIDNFKTNLDTLKNAISGFITGGEEGTGLDTLISRIQGLRGALESAVDELSSLATTFTEVGKTWQEGLIEGFDSNKVVKEIKSSLNALGKINLYQQGLTVGQSFVRGVKSAINTGLSGFNVTVPVNIQPNIAGTVAGVASRIANMVRQQATRSSGGPIYRALGGSIWRKKGTDTVPAMLTPGEFVTRKTAVNKFGLDFMHRINNLDIEGALKALTRKVGISPMQLAYGGGGVTNNRIYNNNAKVTQHIRTENADYSFRRTSRWLRRF